MQRQTLTLDDINQLIKHFAYHIELRITELDQKRGLFLSYHDVSHVESEQSVLVLALIQKYTSSLTANPLQHKLIKKFTQRILQIFNFFKQKTSRHSQSLLNLIQSKIKLKLDSLIDKDQVDIAQVLKFVFSLTRKGTLSNLLRSNHSKSKKDHPSKMNKRYLRSCATSIKIDSFHHPSERQPNVFQPKRTLQNHTVMTKLSAAKSHLTFDPVNPDETSIQKHKRQKTAHIHRPLSTKPTKSLKKVVSDSEQTMLIRPQLKYSFSKKRDSYLKAILNNQIAQKQSRPAIVEKITQIDKLYVGMDIDKRHIEKMIDKRDFLVRDMMKRNQRILNKIKRQRRRQRTFPVEQCCEIQTGMVPRFDNESQSLDTEVTPLGEKNSTNVIMGTFKGLEKRLSLRTMTYQNNTQKKRKLIEMNLSTRRASNIKIIINDKQNMECF